MLDQLKGNKADYYCDYYGFQHELPAKYPHLLNDACYFMIRCFFKLDFI